jgi:hypothetical protein
MSKKHKVADDGPSGQEVGFFGEKSIVTDLSTPFVTLTRETPWRHKRTRLATALPGDFGKRSPDSVHCGKRSPDMVFVRIDRNSCKDQQYWYDMEFSRDVVKYMARLAGILK